MHDIPQAFTSDRARVGAAAAIALAAVLALIGVPTAAQAAPEPAVATVAEPDPEAPDAAGMVEQLETIAPQDSSWAGTDYVALGDSYSAGAGAGFYLDDGTKCYRSEASYPSVIAAAFSWQLDLQACHGATIDDVRSQQLPALDAETGAVTISVGGNDIGFSQVLLTCALDTTDTCLARIAQARTAIDTVLPGELRELYGEISAQAPNASTTVVGYPRLFSGKICRGVEAFSIEEQLQINRAADLLNTRMREAAVAAGLTFVDPTRAFTNHATCDARPWINPIVADLEESFHPNLRGQVFGYAPRVAWALISR